MKRTNNFDESSSIEINGSKKKFSIIMDLNEDKIKGYIFFFMIFVPDIIVLNRGYTAYFVFTMVIGILRYNNLFAINSNYQLFQWAYLFILNIPKYAICFEIYRKDFKDFFNNNQSFYWIIFLFFLQIIIYIGYIGNQGGRWYILTITPIVVIGILYYCKSKYLVYK